MSTTATHWILVALAYASGSVPYGLLIARWRGLDIREHGSGNIGATNVTRALGKGIGALVLLLDAVKGAAVVAIATWWLVGPPWLAAACGLAAVLGHCFPVWLRFHGGKGVATSLGVYLVLDPVAAGLAVVVFALTYAVTRVASVGSLVAALTFPLLLWWRGHGQITIALAGVLAAVIVWRHRDNIARLRQGREHRVT